MDGAPGQQLADDLASSLLPKWLGIAATVVGVYLPAFLIFGFVYDWDFVVGTEAGDTATDPDAGPDALFLSVLFVAIGVIWLGLGALRAAPIAVMRLADRGAIVPDDAHVDDGEGLAAAADTAAAESEDDESEDDAHVDDEHVDHVEGSAADDRSDALVRPRIAGLVAVPAGLVQRDDAHAVGVAARDDNVEPLRRAIAFVERDRYERLTAVALVGGVVVIFVALWSEAWQRTGSANPFWVSSYAEEFDWPSAVAIIGWVPVGGIVFALFTRIYVMIRMTNTVAYARGLHVLVGHPDGAAGLKPLGNQLLRGLFIGAAPATWASVWAIILAADDLSLDMAARSERWLEALRYLMVPAFALLMIPIAVRPILHVRSKIRDANRELYSSVDRLSRTIHQEATAAVAHDDVQRLAEGQDRVESLQKLYDALFPLPTWPFDRGGVAKFVAAVAPSILAITGLGDALVKIIGAALGASA